MAKIKLAIEELGKDLDTNCDIHECPEDTTITDLEKDDQLISLQQDDLNQAQDISDTLETLSTNVDTATGLSDDAAQVLQVVTEHFCRRLGYKHSIVPALESFNDTTRVQNTKLAIENLNKLNIQLNKSINIAHESLLDSIFESIVGVFSKEKELKMEVKRLKEETKNKQVTVEEIPAKNWTTHLRTESSVISGKDVLEITGKLKKVLTSDEVFKSVRELTTSINGIKMDTKDSWFIVNKDTLNRVSSRYNDVINITNEFKRDFIDVGKSDIKTLTPLTEDERNKILNDVENILIDKEMDREIDHLKKVLGELSLALQQFIGTNPGALATTAAAVGTILATTPLFVKAGVTAALVGGIVPYLAVAGVQIIVQGGVVCLQSKLLKSDIILTEDSKYFKLIINKTMKEVEDIISNYRNLTSEKLKICSAALNYVKASVH